ncbi:MAG: hypothetical protein Q7Q71_14820, partial [Verrucomicrobiota bacterium JB023]|nr:hypothetical protein [Verrucomicrobiota bacterium JB023]
EGVNRDGHFAHRVFFDASVGHGGKKTKNGGSRNQKEKEYAPRRLGPLFPSEDVDLLTELRGKAFIAIAEMR